MSLVLPAAARRLRNHCGGAVIRSSEALYSDSSRLTQESNFPSFLRTQEPSDQRSSSSLLIVMDTRVRGYDEKCIFQGFLGTHFLLPGVRG